MKTILTFLIAAMACSGCTYKTSLRVSPAENVNSSYEGKIPGKAALVVVNGSAGSSVNVKPSSFICRAYEISIDAGQIIEDSVVKTTESIFETVVSIDNVPSIEEMKAKGLSGYVLVKVIRLDPNIHYGMSFMTSSAKSSAELAIEVVVANSSNERLLSTMIIGEREKSGNGGVACEGGARVLSEAISATTRETMERYAEKLSNAQKVREEFK